MGYLRDYLKKIWKVPALFLVFVVILATVFWLYDLPVESVLYGGSLCGAAGIVSFFYGYHSYRKRGEELQKIRKTLPLELDKLPAPEDGNESQYQEMLRCVNLMRMDAEVGKQRFYTELTDYYSMWAHQIKTPISALRLILAEEGTKSKATSYELFKIEQYVEMVLGYLRTEDMSADMKFQNCSLDKIIKEQIHKFARIFIGKKLTLKFQETHQEVLTDPKWLGFVIGQILSNSLKYTKTGTISVYWSETMPHTLVIQDTGIGIRKEDLPRVFEKGFTGWNGRDEMRSTGIGLYLSAKIMKRLGHKISIVSEFGKGTQVRLFLGRKEMDMY